MLEVILSICLLSVPDSCRDVLVPGYEASRIETCEQQLEPASDAWLKLNPDNYRLAAAKCSAIGGSADFEEIASGVFAHRGIISDASSENLGDVANIGFIIGEKSIAVVDAGGSRIVAEKVYRAIRKHSDLPISHVILTHMHPDHVLGASVFSDAGARVVGSSNLQRALQDRAASYLDNFGRLIGAAEFIGTRIVTPDTIVDENLSLDLGNRSLELQTWPRSHTNTDMTVKDVQSGILFTGDLVFHQHAPALDGSLIGWRKVLGQMVKLDVKQIVPGHGGPLLQWPSGSTALIRYLEVLEADTRAAVKKGVSLGEATDIIAQSESANWQLFDLFNPRNATVAYTEIEWE